jgi:CRP-like cAMP-binding protein
MVPLGGGGGRTAEGLPWIGVADCDECWLFCDLERREKEALFTRVKFRDFAAGETIWVIGAPGDCGMVVLQGTVQISLPGRHLRRALSRPDPPTTS